MKKSSKKEKRTFLSWIGPGIITGASDDDPSGIATYSQVGAQFGYGMLWTMLFSYPFMVTIQEISARIGRVTGHGLAGNMRRCLPAWLLYSMIGLLFVANTINLGADIGAMGAATKLVVGGPFLLYVGFCALLSVLLEIFIPYTRYVKVLRWLTLALFAYVATALCLGTIPWGQVLIETVRPSLALHRSSVVALVAILGTTISPYLFFWQASEEAEEVADDPDKHALKGSTDIFNELRRISIDTYTGMGFSNLIAFFIILTTAATLHLHGITQIDTAEQAAQALEPLAGHFAFILFALGIIGTGFLALPALAGSAAYALGETFRWKVGLEKKPRQAKAFYAVLALSTLIGAMFNFVGLNPMKALYWSAILNGIVAVPVITIVMVLASRRKTMGTFILPAHLKIMGWMTAGVMLLATIGMFVK